MGERALGWGLRLLGIALFVGPLIAAFAAHGWDLKATVMPSRAEMDEIKGMLGGMSGGELPENTITLGKEFRVENTEISTTVRFNSPFKFPIKITELSGYATCGEHPEVRLAEFWIEENVEIAAEENKTFDVIVDPTQEGINHIASSHGWNMPTSFGLENVNATVELYGVVVKAQVTVKGGL